MASRAWGHGAIQWTPSAVTAKVHMPVNRPKERRVLVATSCTDDEGRLKPTTITLELEGDATILKVKQSLAAHELLAGVAPERMRLTVYGAEATDEQKLQDVSPTAPDVAARLQVIRRSASTPRGTPRGAPTDAAAPEAAGEAASRELPTPRPKVAEPEAEAVTVDGAPPLFYLRSAVCGGRPEALHGVSPTMDVKALRELVAKLPLTIRAWHDDPAAAEEARAAGKSAPANTYIVKPGDEVPANQVLLLGAGVDLDLEPAEGGAGGKEGGEGGGEGGGEDGGEGGAQELAAKGGGDSADGTSGLVHLRDGRQLHEYGLESGSVLYVVVEGPRPA